MWPQPGYPAYGDPTQQPYVDPSAGFYGGLGAIPPATGGLAADGYAPPGMTPDYGAAPPGYAADYGGYGAPAPQVYTEQTTVTTYNYNTSTGAPVSGYGSGYPPATGAPPGQPAGWGGQPTTGQPPVSQGGWGQQPPQQPHSQTPPPAQGGWGQQPPQGQQPPHGQQTPPHSQQGQPGQGGWGQQQPPQQPPQGQQQPPQGQTPGGWGQQQPPQQPPQGQQPPHGQQPPQGQAPGSWGQQQPPQQPPQGQQPPHGQQPPQQAQAQGGWGQQPPQQKDLAGQQPLQQPPQPSPAGQQSWNAPPAQGQAQGGWGQQPPAGADQPPTPPPRSDNAPGQFQQQPQQPPQQQHQQQPGYPQAAGQQPPAGRGAPPPRGSVVGRGTSSARGGAAVAGAVGGGRGGAYAGAGAMGGELRRQEGAGGAAHAFSMEEVRAFTEHFNEVLAGDPDLAKWLAMNPNSMSVFDAIADGVLLCKYINKIKPGTIEERSICRSPKNTFEVSQNHMLALEAARKLGLKIVNIGPTDLVNKTPHLVLGLTWQVIRAGLMDKISVDKHPEMVALMMPGEDVNAFVKLAPEETLLRWFNHHLKRAGHHRQVRNFTSDIMDSENYLVLLNQLDPARCPLAPMHEGDLAKRAELMLQNAEKLGCRKFVSPQDVVNGQATLNLAFLANLFNEHVGLENERRDAETQRQAEEAFRRNLAEEEAARKAAWAQEEAAWRQRMNEEEARLRQQLEQQQNEMRARLQREEEERRRKLEAEEAERRAKWAEEDRKREEEARRRQWDEQTRLEEQRKAEEARRLQEEQIRLQYEEQERIRQQQLQAQWAAEEEAKRQWQAQQLAQQQWQQQQQQQYYQTTQQTHVQYYGAHPQQAMMPQPVVPQMHTVVHQTTIQRGVIPRVCVTVAEARGLRGSDFLGSAPDPYAVVQLREVRYQTRKERSTKSPVWHQEFEFTNFGPQDQLTVGLWDKDRFSHDDFLGQVVLRYEDLTDGCRRWWGLQSRPGVGDRNINGELYLHIRLPC